MSQVPSVGRIVHYVLPDGRSKGEVRPAIIIRVWSQTCVNLQVFIDHTNDYPIPQVEDLWRTSVMEGDKDQLGTWFWPPFVGPIATSYK